MPRNRTKRRSGRPRTTRRRAARRPVRTPARRQNSAAASRWSRAGGATRTTSATTAGPARRAGGAPGDGRECDVDHSCSVDEGGECERRCPAKDPKEARRKHKGHPADTTSSNLREDSREGAGKHRETENKGKVFHKYERENAHRFPTVTAVTSLRVFRWVAVAHVFSFRLERRDAAHGFIQHDAQERWLL
ncbi:hypothetical protein MRX96_022962 [Rhipicephalus microplus]